MAAVRIDHLLREASITLPTHEARQLLAHTLGMGLTDLIRDGAREVDPTAFRALVRRRLAHEPLQLILGTAGFWDFELEVSADTLIPRADSETLIEAALVACPQTSGRVVDLGTGTGCLLLAFLRARPGWFGVGVDLLPAAAALATRNARRVGVADRAGFAAGSWGGALAGGFDLMLCNPPYIPRGDIADLAPDVRDWEPMSALDGGADGLGAYRVILGDLARLLAPRGAGVLELGVGQAASVAGIARGVGLGVETVRADLGGIERALVVRTNLGVCPG